MKITKRQLQRIIKEEKRKITEQGSAPNQQTWSETVNDLEYDLAMALQEQFEAAIGAESYEGTGPGWEQEISRAGMDYNQAIIDSGALKMALELFADVEERLHNGDYA